MVQNKNGVKKKVLFVVNNADFFLSHRLPLALAAREIGYDVCVATPSGPGCDAVVEHGFNHYEFPFSRSGRNIVQEIKTFLALYQLYKNVNPDIVHHVTIKPVIYGSIVAKFTQVRAVINAVPGLGYIFISKGIRAWIRKTIVKVLYRIAFMGKNLWVIFQNSDDLDSFINSSIIKKEKTVLIKGSGVNLRDYSVSVDPSGIFSVILPARMLRDKGVVEFADASRLLKKEGINSRFILIGDCDEGNPAVLSRDQIAEWEKEGVVDYWGFRDDMPSVLSSAHVVCLPSYREGLPKALLEAMACGRAIITTDVPGCREVVVDGLNGIMVPPKDASSLADAIKRLYLDAELRKKMGVEGRKLVESEFSEDHVVHQTMKLYESVLDI